MTTTLARLIAALALVVSLGVGFMAAPAALAQDETATEVTDEGEDAVDEAQQEGEEAVDEVQQEGEEAVDTAQEEVEDAAAQVTDEDDDDFDDWGLLGLLGLLGLGGLLKRPERNVVVDETPATRAAPTTRP
jgi:MYXO-CTERM domain-containing protein